MQPRELSRGDRRCLNWLRPYLHGKDYCWVRQKVIAEKMGVGLRTVKRHYAALVEAKEIKIHKRGGQQSALVTVTSAVTSLVTSEILQAAPQGNRPSPRLNPPPTKKRKPKRSRAPCGHAGSSRLRT
jgi:Helix-turn-helix domain